MSRIRFKKIVTADVTPDSGQISLYAKNDNSFYFKTDIGTERLILHDAMPGVMGYEVEIIVVSSAQVLAKQIVLSATPANPSKTLVQIDGASAIFFGVDFTLSGNVLTWSGLRLDGLLDAGDLIQVIYY